MRGCSVRFMDIKETESRNWNKETNMNKRKCLKVLGDFIFYGLLASVVIISVVGKWDPYIIPFWIFSFLMGFERWYKKRKAEKDKK